MLNIFKSLSTSHSFASVSIDDVMTAIKTGYFKHKTYTVNTGAIEASKEDKYSTEDYIGGKNMYNFLKVNRVMTWCPNASFNSNHRHNTQLKQLTGYVYCDIDGINPDTAKELLIKLPFVYSVWASLSGTGVGFLVKADWTVDNFKANYKALSAYFLAEHKLELDKTSDFTRTNVFSYDPNYCINIEASNIDSKTLSPYIGVTTNPYIKSTPTAKLSTVTQSNFDELVEELNVTVDYTSKVKVAINYAIKSKGLFEDGNRHNFLTSLIGTANKIGIPYEILVEEFENYLVEENSFDLFDAVGFDNIYASFEGQKETLYNNLLNLASVKTITPTLKLKVDRYLNDRVDNQLPKAFTKNTILVSPTGSGKSTYVMEQLEGKRILVCPNTAILKNFKSFKGTSVFYGDEKSESFTDIILTTQDSFELLTNVLADRNDHILNYLIIVDEFHTLVSSANKGYKYTAITKTLAILEDNPLVVLGLTATPISTVTNPFYQSFDLIEVSQAKDVTREIQLSEYDDYRSFIIEKCLENYKGKTISVVYKNSKQSVDILKEALEGQGLTVAIINADTKETAEYQSIVENGDVTVDVILTTCLLKEGVSVKGRGDRVSVDYIISGENHYTEVNQLSSRVRNAETITITLASSTKSYKDYTRGFLLSNVIEHIDSANNFLLPRFNNDSLTEVEFKLDQRLIGSAIKFSELDEKFVVDNIYKDFLIYEEEKKICNVNPLYTIVNLLQDPRFEVFSGLLVYNEDNKEAIIAAKKEVQKNNVATKLDFKTTVDTCAGGITTMEKLDSIKENGSKEEQEMAFYTKYIFARQKKSNLYAAIDKAEELSDSKRKFNEFKTQLELTELFTNGKGSKGVSTKFFKELKKTIKLNVEYTTNEIYALMQKAANKTGAEEFIKMSKTKATQWFKMLGTTYDKTCKNKVTRKSFRVYVLKSWGLDNYNYTPNYSDTEETLNTPVIMFLMKGKK